MVEKERMYSHVADNVRVDEGALVVALKLLAAYSGAYTFVSVTFRGERCGLRAGGLIDRPDGWLVARECV